MKLLRKIITIVAVIVVLIGGSSIIALQFIDKSLLERKVEEATGRKMVIAGELKPQLSMMPSVKVTDVSFANAEWGTRADMAKIGELQVELQLIPLLSGEVRINTLEVKDADILLEKKGNKWNFEFDKKESADGKKAASEEKPDTKKTSLDIDKLLITNSLLTIKQGADQTRVNAEEISLAPENGKSRFKYKGKLNNDVLNISLLAPRVAELMDVKNFPAEDVNVQFGDYKIKGKAEVNLEGAKPNVNADLSSDKIVLKAKPAASAGDAHDAGGKKAAGSDKLPFDSFNMFNGNIALKIGRFESGDIILENVSAPIKVNNGTLTINPLKADFAKGKIDSVIKLSPAQTSIKLDGKNLSMEQILAQLADMNDFKGGATSIALDLKGSGDTVDRITGSLSGQSNIYMEKGVYTKALNTGSVEEFAKLLGGGSSKKSTDLNCVLANIKWNGGVGKVEQMAVDTNYAYVLGKGDIKLNSKKIDMVLTPKAKSPGLASFAVPVAVKGSITNPSFFPDPQGTAVSLAKNFAGFYTGGISILATEVTDRLGITGESNPCAAALSGKAGGSDAAENKRSEKITNPVKDVTDKIGLDDLFKKKKSK